MPGDMTQSSTVTADARADEAMQEIWRGWLSFYEGHFRAPHVKVSMADQQAFYEIAQPVLRCLASGIPAQLQPQWQPIETAPKDGTPLFLLVWQDLFAESSSNPTEDEIAFRTMGHNNYDHDGIDCWQFAGWDWEQDCYTQARGKPSHWQPIPDRPIDESSALPSTPSGTEPSAPTPESSR